MKKILLMMFMTLTMSSIGMAQQKLWTVLTNGGTINSTGNGTYGIIMVYDPINNVWTNKHSFARAEGIAPSGAPVVATDGNLYGTCNDQGSGYGSVWKYDIANDAFSVVHQFTATTGRYALGNLIQASNGKIYGMTEQQGANNRGTLFELNITTGAVTKVYDFNTATGYNAYSRLVEASPGKLLGVTRSGGDNSNGVLFEFNTTNNTYTKKVDFSNATSGSNPWAGLVKAPNGKFYGMTSVGGTNNIGTLYEYDYSNNAFLVKQHFTTTTGSGPKGALTLAEDGMLYGMTELNGVNNKGTLFQYDYVNNVLTKKIDFNGTANGTAPNASLVENNGKLYGMTVNGGVNNSGTIFEYDYINSTLTKKQDFQILANFGAGFPFMASFVVQNCPAVSISTQPANATVCTSGSTSFSVAATGTSLSYQWQVKTGGSGYANLVSDATYSGVNSATLSVNATAALHGYFYRCVIGSSTCTSYSNSASLTVNSNPSVTPSVAINVTSGSSTMCSGSSITFTSTPTNGGTTPAYQWKVDGTNVGTNSTNYTTTGLTNAAVVTCVMTSNELCASAPTATSSGITMNVTTTVTPSVTISVTSGSSTMCAGSSITFTATPVHGGAAPSYQWKVNGTNDGTNSNTFTSSSLANNAVVTCVLTSNASCVTSATATSSGITMNVSPLLTPAVAVTVTSGSSTMCAGSSITFTAAPTHGGTSPSYQWKVDGTAVGSNNTTYTSSALTNGQVVTCEMTSNATCVTSPTATSNSITMNVTSNVTPTVAINITFGSSTTCAGSTITFKATPSSEGASPAYQWKVNGVNTGTNSEMFSSTALTNNAQVTCVLTSSVTCVTSTTANSNTITMNVTANVSPSLLIAVTSGNATMCSGSSVEFTATPTHGGTSPSYQWKVDGSNVATGLTYTSSSLSDGQVVTCEMTSNATCVTSSTTVSSGLTMHVTTPFSVNALVNGNASSSVCENTNLNLTVTTIAGATYSWTGPNSYTSSQQNPVLTSVSTSVAGTYTVTVNAGACASQSSATVVVNAAPAVPTITADLNAMVLTSSNTSGNQWYLDGALLTGETNQSLSFTTAGSYTVTFTNGTCSSESLPYVYTLPTAAISRSLSGRIQVYPNPSEGIVRVSLSSHSVPVITVKDLYGTSVYSGAMNGSLVEIDLSGLSKGIYFVNVKDGDEEGVVKIIID